MRGRAMSRSGRCNEIRRTISQSFEFSSHFHLADFDETGAPSAAHVCGYCAAMQVGVGPISVTIHIASGTPEPVEPEAE